VELGTQVKVSGATISEYFSNTVKTTDANGVFQFTFPVGANVTFKLQKATYETTWSGLFTLTSSGLTGVQNQVTFQVIYADFYNIVKGVVTVKRNTRILPNTCQVVATVGAKGKTVQDELQGEPDAKISLSRAGTSVQMVGNNRPYYFGVIPGLNKNRFLCFRSHDHDSGWRGSALQFASIGDWHQIFDYSNKAGIQVFYCVVSVFL